MTTQTNNIELSEWHVDANGNLVFVPGILIIIFA